MKRSTKAHVHHRQGSDKNFRADLLISSLDYLDEIYSKLSKNPIFIKSFKNLTVTFLSEIFIPQKLVSRSFQTLFLIHVTPRLVIDMVPL